MSQVSIDFAEQRPRRKCGCGAFHKVPEKADLFDGFEQTVTDVPSPIISVAKDVTDAQDAQAAIHHEAASVFHRGHGPRAFDALTGVEAEDAILADCDAPHCLSHLEEGAEHSGRR